MAFKQTRSFQTLLVRIAFSIFLYLINYMLLMHPLNLINNWGVSFISKIESGIMQVKKNLENLSTFFEDKERLTKKIESLNNELLLKESLLLKYQLILSENIHLKRALEIKKELNYTTEHSYIISNDLLGATVSFLIDKGSVHGIKYNSPVVAIVNNEPVVVGKIIETFPEASRVETVFNREFYVPAKIQETNNLGLVSGYGYGKKYLIMKYVPFSFKNNIEIGYTIVTSSLSSIFPEGIKIGIIKEVIANNYDSSLNIIISPYININQLEDVFVIVKSDI